MNSKHIKNILRANKAVDQHNDAENDDYRFNYHFSPITGWMNDPNGLIYYKNRYHAFYQYHPYSTEWGPMHWGHAVSDDLIRWEHLPVALAPSEEYDANGCFSGCSVEEGGDVSIIYTGSTKDDRQVQCLARSADGICFEKYTYNPIIAKYPKEGSKDFRDPKAWKYEGKWYAVIGSAKNGKGKVLAYKSDDLVNWNYIGVAFESDICDNYIWECPNIISIGDKHLLILSSISESDSADECLYFVGDMDYCTGKFKQEYSGKVDCGTDFYAPQVFYGTDNRIIMIGWMDNWKGQRVTKKFGWEGAFTLPRELIIDDNKLYCRPVQEIKKFRGNHVCYSDFRVENSFDIDEVLGNSVEILLKFESKGNFESYDGINIYLSDSEKISILYNEKDEIISLRVNLKTKSVVKQFNIRNMSSKEIELDIFIDVSSLEIFMNNGAMVITERIYPIDPKYEIKLRLISTKSAIHVKQLDVWNLSKN